MLQKMNSIASDSDIIQQNKILENMAVSRKAVTKNLLENVAIYVTVDNNGAVQETITGKGTTHDTNITRFQLLCSST